MITLNPEQGFIVYVLIMFLIFAIVAVYETLRTRALQWSLSKEELGTCAECSCTFVVGRHQKIVRCPRCSKLCSIRRK